MLNFNLVPEDHLNIRKPAFNEKHMVTTTTNAITSSTTLLFTTFRGLSPEASGKESLPQACTSPVQHL